MIHLEEHPEGVVVSVKASAGAKRDELRGEHAGALKVAVTQAPEKGKANKAIIELLARELHIKKSQIELLSGETSSQKKFLFRGVTDDLLRAQLGGK
jgi:uncharacterized protein